MRDNFVDSSLDSEASQKEDERYGAGVCGTFMVWLCVSNLFGLMGVSGGIEMIQHLVTASTGLGGPEPTAWGKVFICFS